MNRLTAALVDTCQEHRIVEKWLLVPNLRVGHQWIEQVTRARCPVVNLRIKTLRSIAIELAAPEIAARGLHLCNSRTGALLVYQVLHALQNPDGPSHFEYLADIELNTLLAKTTHSSIEALRLAGIGLADLATEHFEVARKGSDLFRIIETYERRLRAERLVDYSAVLEMATARLQIDPTLVPQDVLVVIPEDLPRAVLEQRMLDRVGPRHRHELPVDRPADASHSQPVASDRELLRWLCRPAGAPAPRSDGTARLVRVVGEVNEVRAVLRTCLAEGIWWDDVEPLHTDASALNPRPSGTVPQNTSWRLHRAIGLNCGFPSLLQAVGLCIT